MGCGFTQIGSVAGACLTESIARSTPGCGGFEWVPDQRAGHAVAAAAPPAELRARDGDDLDPGLAQQAVGVRVAVVGEDDAGLQRDKVVTAVPLLPLGGVDVAAGLDDAKLADAQGLRHHIGELLAFLGDLDPGPLCWAARARR